MSSTTLHPIEIFYGEEGVSYTSWLGKQKKVPTNVHEYARYRNVSSDGCQTTKDVDARNTMLKSIVRAHESGWIK